MDISKIDNDWLIMLVAMVKDCGHMVKCPNVDKKRREVALPLRQERKIRGLRKASVYEPLKTNKVGSCVLPEGFFKGMDDDAVKIWYAIGSEIADYSMLGTGVRPYVITLWKESDLELTARGISSPGFYALKM